MRLYTDPYGRYKDPHWVQSLFLLRVRWSGAAKLRQKKGDWLVWMWKSFYIRSWTITLRLLKDHWKNGFLFWRWFESWSSGKISEYNYMWEHSENQNWERRTGSISPGGQTSFRKSSSVISPISSECMRMTMLTVMENTVSNASRQSENIFLPAEII